MFPGSRALSLALFGIMIVRLAAHAPVEEITESAARFVAALSPEQKAGCTFALTEDERTNWHFVPRPRKGISLKELTPTQRHLAYGLIASGLSHSGYLKVTSIMSLEEILKELEKGRGPIRDPELFYISVFGKPEAGEVWGWRIEGHHLSLNFVIGGSEITVTPSFFGANPAKVSSGPREGLRVLAREEDLARELVRMLAPDQQRTAIYTNRAPSDIVTGANRKAQFLSPAGLPASSMTPAQTDVLKRLVSEYVRRYRPEIADAALKKIESAGLDKLWFAWAGSVEPGQPHYYRVQGPSFLLEYDNTQNRANHVHTVWRDLESDFGDDLLRKHYDQDHQSGSVHADH